jgi:hypothetical protein
MDLVLAKYTCVALQRLNGSVKKVKGDFHRWFVAILPLTVA